MQLIVDMPDNLINGLCFTDIPQLETIIKNGTPLPSGHWIKFGAGKHAYKCSECDRGIIGRENYCSNCGARMEGKG